MYLRRNVYRIYSLRDTEFDRQTDRRKDVSILSFRRVLYVVCFLLGISPASEV